MTPEEIREIREKAGMSQEAMAELLKCSVSTVSGWERGEHLPSRPFVKLLTALRENAPAVEKTIEVAAGETVIIKGV